MGMLDRLDIDAIKRFARAELLVPVLNLVHSLL
jgi:hypothetical protein